ncbi:MAG: hypothetical protein RMX68_033690 [Aulosira sp. ZfuVER01]|nr:hypothetical protein [Aulosira sp. ZfuVER01]MDZ7996746.1 hypothetical protein [Aulosira sp. DedVER01a]MDZ8049872.1 hypothetical protein [Aulosira sp. ZfuCHP01]
MQTKLFWFMLGILLWLGFGALIAGLGAMIVKYTWVLSIVGYGAAIGAMSGFIITSLGLAIAARVRSQDVIVWVVLGSIVGAGIGFKSVVLFGHYPTGSQADLSFLLFAPMAVGIGTLLGIVFALGMWKFRYR